MLKWFNSVVLFKDKCYKKNGVKSFIKRLVIIKSTVLGGRLKKTVIVKFSNIIVIVETFNGFSIKFVEVKFIVKSISVKSVREPGRNLKINILEKDILFSFKKLLLELINLLK